MPVKYETDPVTGKVTEVFEFGPQKPAKPTPANKLEQALKPANLIGQVKGIAEAVNPTGMVGQGLKAAGAGLQTLQKTGDIGKAFGATTKAMVDDSNKAVGPAGAIKRVPQRALFTTLQENSDFVQEVGAKILGKKSPTSAKTPDAPFLGVLPALPRARSSGPAEDLAVGALQLGLGFVTGSAAVGLGGLAVRGAFAALPMAARLGVATTRLRAAKDLAAAAAPFAQAGTKISGVVQAGVKAAGPVGQVVQAGASAVTRSGLSQVTGKAAITSAITDVVAFDQYTGRLTDAANDLVKGTAFEPLVIDYLKSDPNDGALEGRFKNALEGLLLGGALELPFRFFKQVKAVKNYNKAVAGKTELDKLKDPKVLEALDDVKNANDAFQTEVVKQTETREADPGEQPSFADELDRPVGRNVAEVAPTTLAIDPQRFQYKLAGAKTKTGVSGSLKESKEYNPELAGIISVWKDPATGKDFVVNGHNRVQKALESGTAKVLVRYIQTPDAVGARAVGALQNIAEGQGTPIDAAKFLRDMKAGPENLENFGVNLTGRIASRAIPLARLPQNVFDQVATGALTEDRAIALGSVRDLDETIINSVAARAEKGKWSADKITQAMQEAKFATASTPTAGGGMLPGFEDFFATSNFDQLLDVRTEAAKALREGVVALSSAARAGRQGVLEAAGNVIDVAGSQAAKATAQQAVNLFDRVTQYEGPVRALLNNLAAQITPKKKAAQVVKENLAQIRAAIDDEANGPRLPFEEPAPEAPRPQPTPVEPEAAAPALPLSSILDARTGQPIAIAGFRGEGKAKADIYAGPQIAIGGEGRYIAVRQMDAKQYGDKITGETIQLESPLVIDSDSAWRELTQAAGWRTGNLVGQDDATAKGLTEQLKQQVISRGHDGLIIWVPESEMTGKTLQRVFDHDQVIAYNQPQPTASGAALSDSPERLTINEFAAAANRGVIGPANAPDFQRIQRPEVSIRDDRPAGAQEGIDKTNVLKGKTLTSADKKQIRAAGDINSNRILKDIDQGLNLGYKTDDLAAFVVHSYMLRVDPAYLQLASKKINLEELKQLWTSEATRAAYDDMQQRSTTFGKQSQPTASGAASVSAAEEIVDNVLTAVAAPKAGTPDEIRLAAAEKNGNTVLADQLRERIARTAVQPMGNVAAAAIEPPSPLAAEIKAATRKFGPNDGGRMEGAARAYKKYFDQGKRQVDEITDERAYNAVVAANVAFDPDAVKSLNMDQVRSDIGMGRFTPEVKAAQDAYRSIYDPSFTPLRSREPELPGLPKKPIPTREEIQARLAEIDALLKRIEANELDMTVDEPATRALAEELTKIIRTVAGDEPAIRFNDAFMETKEGDAAWGYKPGETMKYSGTYDPTQDIIEVNNLQILSSDVQQPDLLRFLTDKLEQSAFHESFHRVQFNFLKPEELRVFNQFLAGFKLEVGAAKEIAANLKGGRDELLPIEKAAVSFQIYAWARKNNLDPVQALLGATRDELEKSSGLQKAAFAVMDTLYDFVERVGNAFKERGFISIKSIFEDAYSGKLAKRGELGSVLETANDPNFERLDLLQTMSMAYEDTRRGGKGLPALKSSAERFIDEYENVKAKIASGEMTLDDLITNVVADRNVQPMQSPSGETAYVPDPEAAEGASAAMRAWMNAGGTREEVSGMPTIPDEIVKQQAERWLAKNDYQAKAVLGELEYRAGSLENAAALQKSLLMAQYLADYTNNKAAIVADQWLNSKYDTNVDRDALRQELLAIYKHASDVNTPVVKVTRALGQVLRTGQIQRPQPGSIDFKNTLEEYKLDEILENGAKEEEAVTLAEHLGDKIDPAFNEAIINGEFTPELDAMIDQIAYNLKATRDVPGFAPSFWSQINKGSKIGLNGLVMYRSAQLLSSGLTFWGNTLNGVVRLIQMPLAQIVGAGLQGQFERAGYSAQIYGQYIRNLPNAFALAKESYKAGRTLYDIDNQSLDFLDQQINKDQGELIPLTGPVILPTSDKGFTVSTMPWINIQDKTSWAIAQKRLWQTATSPIRAQIAADTLFKVLAGQSFEFVRNLPMGMDNAVAQGLERNSQEAMEYAQRYADEAVKRATRHATVEGRTILDAIMTSPHAQTAMRYATFTDDIDAQMEVRTFDRGMEIAKDKKLEGPAAEAWAREWADKKQDIPFFTKGPSVMPMVWQKLIDFHPAFAVLQPFNRTPGDIIKSALRMTPAAPFVDTAYRDLNSMDAMTRDRVIGDVAVGSSAIALAMVGLSAGIVEMTGGGPQDPGAKQKWRDSGKQPYSIRFKDTPWVSYRVTEPFATIFGAVADYFEIQGNLTKEQRENLGDALTLTVLSMVASGTLSKTYYQGFTEFYEAVAGNAALDIQPNSRSSWTRYFSRIAASLEPASSALRAGRRIDDRAVRTIEPGSFFSETLDEIRNQTPGWSEGIPARINWLTGDMIVQSGILGDAHLPPDNPWLSMAMQYVPWSPLQRGAEQSSIDPVAAEMARLHSKGANFRGPHAADFGRQNRLGPTEFGKYNTIMATVTDPNFNTTVYQELDSLMKSKFYQDQPITEPSTEDLSGRALQIDGVIQKYKQLAKQVYLETRPDLQLILLKQETADNDVKYQLKYGLNPQQFQQEALR